MNIRKFAFVHVSRLEFARMKRIKSIATYLSSNFDKIEMPLMCREMKQIQLTYTLGTQSRTVLSLDADAMRCPEGENLTDKTAS